MIDLSRYRVIDLSYEMIPGEKKINGEYLHGEPFVGRGIELQEFMAYGARMHFIQSQTHNGTHCESTYKYVDEGPDSAGMALESHLGAAVICDFSSIGPGGTISGDDFAAAGVQAGDIVLVRTNPDLTEREHLPYFTADSLNWLIDVRIKMLGSGGNLLYGPPDVPDSHINAEERLLRNGIPCVDCVNGLEQITKERVFFIALPLKMKRVTATWTRAIALEELD